MSSEEASHWCTYVQQGCLPLTSISLITDHSLPSGTELFKKSSTSTGYAEKQTHDRERVVLGRFFNIYIFFLPQTIIKITKEKKKVVWGFFFLFDYSAQFSTACVFIDCFILFWHFNYVWHYLLLKYWVWYYFGFCFYKTGVALCNPGHPQMPNVPHNAPRWWSSASASLVLWYKLCPNVNLWHWMCPNVNLWYWIYLPREWFITFSSFSISIKKFNSFFVPSSVPTKHNFAYAAFAVVNPWPILTDNSLNHITSLVFHSHS